jgi:predicted DNA binding protein
MSVIVELELAAHEFELGRILQVPAGTHIEMEAVVPAAERTIPLFWVYSADIDTDTFETCIRSHDSVNSITAVDIFEDRALYAMDWAVGSDRFFQAVVGNGGSILNAAGFAQEWGFEVRFASHDDLGSFRADLEDARVTFEVLRVYNPTRPDAGPWYGLTPSQREALTLAVEAGYYDIPRTCTTVELADKLDISDQAVTERLRRAIVNLVSNTLLAAEDERG